MYNKTLTLVVQFNAFFKMCTTMLITTIMKMGLFPLLWKISLCLFAAGVPHLPWLQTTIMFFLVWKSFQEFRINGIFTVYRVWCLTSFPQYIFQIHLHFCESIFCSFLLLSTSLLYACIHTTIYLSVCLLMGIWVVCSLGLLHIKLFMNIHMHNFIQTYFPVLLEKYIQVELLGCVVSVHTILY